MTCFYPTNGLNPSDRNDEERKERQKCEKSRLGKTKQKEPLLFREILFLKQKLQIGSQKFLEGKYVQFRAKPCFLYRWKISLSQNYFILPAHSLCHRFLLEICNYCFVPLLTNF
jgi:hypothetical protein